MKYSNTIIALLCIASVALTELNPQRVAIVDRDDKLKNYLVRGSLPISNQQKFQIRELKEHLANITGLRKF